MTSPRLLTRSLLLAVVIGISSQSLAASGDPQTPLPPLPGPLKYSFELSAESPRTVRVTIRTETPDTKESTFAVQPHWGGEDHVEREVTRPEATGEAGRKLELSQDQAAPHQWLVRHEPREVVSFSYVLAPPPDRAEKETNQYRPILTDSLFHFIGEVGLIAPAWLNEARDVMPIELAWQGFDEAGWKVVSSLGVGTAPRSVRLTISDFRHSLFMAGKIRVVERKSGPGTVAVGIFGSDWKFDDDAFADLVQRIVQAEREFFSDFEDPFFLVSLIPTRDQGAQSFSLGGTGLTDCFALFCSPSMSLDADSPRRLRTLHLLAHEYFHTWNGRKISQDEPGELTYWFSEGFTDFYAARLLYNAGLITPQQWIDTVNEDLAAYFTSPVRTASADQIRTDFWKDRDVQQLPYKRGSAVALVIDWEMRKRSDGKRGLNDFMRETLALSRERGEKVSNDRLFQRIAAWTSSEFAAAMRGVVEEGKMLELPSDLFAPALKCEMREQASYAPGFDVTASVRDKRATGVQPGGAAATAGLRDGMQIVGMSIYGGDPNRLIELTVREGENTQQIKFMPRGPSVSMPVLQLVSPPKF